jgi:hypothetical protein
VPLVIVTSSFRCRCGGLFKPAVQTEEPGEEQSKKNIKKLKKVLDDRYGGLLVSSYRQKCDWRGQEYLSGAAPALGTGQSHIETTPLRLASLGTSPQ